MSATASSVAYAVAVQTFNSLYPLPFSGFPSLKGNAHQRLLTMCAIKIYVLLTYLLT